MAIENALIRFRKVIQTEVILVHATLCVMNCTYTQHNWTITNRIAWEFGLNRIINEYSYVTNIAYNATLSAFYLNVTIFWVTQQHTLRALYSLLILIISIL